MPSDLSVLRFFFVAGAGLQNLHPRFKSGRRLQFSQENRIVCSCAAQPCARKCSRIAIARSLTRTASRSIVWNCQTCDREGRRFAEPPPSAAWSWFRIRLLEYLTSIDWQHRTVLIPDGQPITPQQSKFCHSCTLRRSISAAQYVRSGRPAAVFRLNLRDFNGLARIKRVRIPSRCRASKRSRVRRHEPVPHPSRHLTTHDSYRMR